MRRIKLCSRYIAAFLLCIFLSCNAVTPVHAAGDIIYYNQMTDLALPYGTSVSGCYTTSAAMILTAMGKASATPYDIYKMNGNSVWLAGSDTFKKTYNVTFSTSALSGTEQERYDTIYSLCQQYSYGVFLRGTTPENSDHAIVAYIDAAGTLRIHDPGIYSASNASFTGRATTIGASNSQFKAYTQLEEYRIFVDHGPVNAAPRGVVDNLSAGKGTLSVSGWTFDPDTPHLQNDIHIYINDTFAGALTANAYRPDVDDYYTCGDYHGFSGTIQTTQSGSCKVDIYAMDTANGYNPIIHTATVDIPSPDAIAPVVSDIRILDLCESGYTIRCTVDDGADGSGIAKVRFPTWTEANGQDDLAANWDADQVDTVQGTRISTSGTASVYEFRVDIADHNNESGLYHTHIYAYDNMGNVTIVGSETQGDYGVDIHNITVPAPSMPITLVNALRVANYLAGKSGFSAAELTAADFNADGYVTILDLYHILQALTNIL